MMSRMTDRRRGHETDQHNARVAREIWARERANRLALEEAGVMDPIHVRLLLATIPCAIETVAAALADKTLVQVNAPRALLVEGWQAQVRMLAAVERARSAAS